MRAHVELIHDKDYVWHIAELPRGEGRVRQRNLSYDEENGAASTKLYFETAWNRLGGYHEADTEWFVLSGEVKLGDKTLGQGTYFRAPAGLSVPPISVKEGSEVLLFREYGDWGFSVSERSRSAFIPRGGNTASSEPGELTIVAASEMEWIKNIYEGDTQAELRLKMLYHDPSPSDDYTKGFVSLLCWAPPRWSDDRMIHHPCFEEAYTLDGTMEYNFGSIVPGTYFFRPARVKHGHFVAGEEKGAVWFFRLDGHLINWVTVEEKVIVQGTPLNYDPKTQGPVMAGIPVRSRTTGQWNLDGQ
ncbi:MAG: DUF4437 domain-containing protein [Acidobacteria bacterium]|nr:DUF4437 domain-containing protein [Acidobacteriota bacterium]